MFFVYILKSLKDNSYYIGSTANLTQRLKLHNQGKSMYTKNKRPWKLLYFEKYPTRAEAVKREIKIKSRKKRCFIEKLIASEKIGTVLS